MAIICREHKLLFLMVPRTGCSSVGEVLKEKFGGEWIPKEPLFIDNKKVVPIKHNTIQQLVKFNIISRKELKSYLKFATVRNPFDRYTTYYARLQGTWMEDWLKSSMEEENSNSSFNKSELYREQMINEKTADIERARNEDFEKWLYTEVGIDRKKSFKRSVRDWIKSRMDPFYMPEIYPIISGVDEIIRYENLENDFNSILRKAGVTGENEWISIPYTNKTPGKKPYQEYYSPEARAFIENRFARELAVFGYTFD